MSTNPHVTANPFAIEPIRFVISPTSIPPIALDSTGTSAHAVHDSYTSLTRNSRPAATRSASNTIGTPVIAISSVIIVGALIAVGPEGADLSKILGFIAVTLAAVNIFGGFTVTHRMLQMFKKKERAGGDK